MYYASTATVLATLAISQVSAASLHHRHAHDKRAPAPSAAPIAQPAPQDGYYNGAKITYSADQQWGTWGGTPQQTGAPVAPQYVAPAPAPPAKKIDTAKKNILNVDHAPAKPAKDSTPKKIASTNSTGGTSDLSAAIFKTLNAKPVESNGMITDTPNTYSMDLCNESGQELGFYCWPGSSGWNIQTDCPIFAASIPAGKTHTVYMGAGSSKIACAALHSGAHMDSTNGIPVETQIELTMAASDTDATFDVSQLETASGHHVKMESSVCTAEANGKCSYQCLGSAPCGYVPGQVKLLDCLGEGTTGNAAATDGGCSVGPEKHIKVSFS